MSALPVVNAVPGLDVEVVVPPEHTFPDHDAWAHARSLLPGIGASDVGTVMGLDPWKSLRALADEKHGRMTRGPLLRGGPAHVGLLMEQGVIDRWAADHPEYEVLPSPGTVRGSRSWLTCTPDALVRHRDTGWTTVLQVKYAADRMWRRPYTEGGYDGGGRMPARYAAQVMAELAVVDRPLGYFAALSGHDFLDLRVEVTDGFLARLDGPVAWLVEAHVLGDEPVPVDPEPDDTPVVAATVAEALVLTGSDAERLLHLRAVARDAAAQVKDWKARQDAATDEARALLGAHEAAVVGSDVVATYRPTKARLRVADLTADHPDLAAAYMGEPSRTFRWKD